MKTKRSRKDYKQKFINDCSYFWMCTWFDIDKKPDASLFLIKPEAKLQVKAFIFQKEICPTTKRPHYQCYFEFMKKVKLQDILKSLGLVSNDSNNLTGSYWQPRKKTHQNCLDYCSKEDTRADPKAVPVTYGTFSQELESRKQANDDNGVLKSIELVKSGATLKDIWDQCPQAFYLYRGNIASAICMQTKPRDWACKVIILHGPTGCGKSRWAKENYPDAYLFQPPGPGKQEWWPDYMGQEVVIVNEFYGQLEFDYLLNLLDRYPMTVQTKGGFVPMVAKTFIFTSNSMPSFWYADKKKFDGSKCDFRVLRRRITEAYGFCLQENENNELSYRMIRTPEFECPSDPSELYNFHLEMKRSGDYWVPENERSWMAQKKKD